MKNKTSQAYFENFPQKIFTRSVILLLTLLFSVSLISAIPQTFNVHIPSEHENLWIGGKLSNDIGALTGTYEMKPRLNLIKGVEI